MHPRSVCRTEKTTKNSSSLRIYPAAAPPPAHAIEPFSREHGRPKEEKALFLSVSLFEQCFRHIRAPLCTGHKAPESNNNLVLVFFLPPPSFSFLHFHHRSSSSSPPPSTVWSQGGGREEREEGYAPLSLALGMGGVWDWTTSFFVPPPFRRFQRKD